MHKSYLVLLPVIKPVDLHATNWLTQIYIFIFIRTLKRYISRLVMDHPLSNKWQHYLRPTYLFLQHVYLLVYYLSG